MGWHEGFRAGTRLGQRLVRDGSRGFFNSPTFRSFGQKASEKKK